MSRLFPTRLSVSTAVAVVASCVAGSASAQPPVVDPMDRSSVVTCYETVYQASEGVSSGWTGNVAGCTPGTVTSEYLAAGILRVQYFRAMAGLPTALTHDPTLDAKCQDAALMMTANQALSHSPPSGWTCYTATGAEAAGKSNLALGYSTLPAAVTGWILDPGVNTVGHRRWLLYPPQSTVGIGATFGSGSSNGYAMWVLGPFGSRPGTPEWVAWPPQGYVPYQLVPTLWSFSRQSADFSGATVTMTRGATPVPVVLETVQNGYGDNTLVWTPQGLPGGAPNPDVTYSVTVANVLVSGSPREFTYSVTVIDPSMTVPARPTTWGRLKTRYGN